MNKIIDKRNKMKICKGDEVVVVSGKDKGKKGVVQLVMAKSMLVLVEGVNKFKKAVKIGQNNNENFLIKERPMLTSKVKVLKKAPKGKNNRLGKKNIKE